MRNFKKFLALVLAMMMVVGGMVTVSAAEEKAAADYTAAAEALADLGIVKGNSDDVIDFALDEKVVRYQQALLFARIMTGETDDLYWSTVENTTPFADVKNYYGAIAYVAEQGVVNGYPNGNFGPEDGITYQDALTMAVRSLGYKQLVYPTGFVNSAKTLGLTAGLEEDIGMEQQLTRGQMFQIIYNTLYAADKNGKSFAEKNFGLESKVYVIVATNLQYMVGADRVEKTGYVALAKLNADGTYDFNNYYHFTEAELGLKKGEAEQKLGYSYTVRSYSKYADILDIVPNNTKTVQNYGDNGITIKGGTKYNSINESNLVSVDGITYSLVKSFSDLNNKSTSVGRNPELIVHSLYKGDKDSAFQYYIYNANGDILDKDGNIALMYNRFTNTYYKVLGDNQYRLATEEDFAEYAISITGAASEQYGLVTKASDLTTIQFSEMTLIDDNNDGAYDRAIYIPYSVGKFETSSQANAWKVGSSANSGSTKLTVVDVNDTFLPAVCTDTNGKWASRDKIQQSDITFIGEGRPASGEYVVYYYNPFARIFNVVENLGKPVTGKVQSMSQGTYAYDSTNMTYYYKGATVTIDGNTYVLGYRPYQTMSQYANNTTDLQSIDANLANYGYSTVIYNSLLASAYKPMAYVVLAGRLIKAADGSNSCGWMTFDYGTYGKVEGLGYTTYEYTGDILGVDEAGNILVKAYVDKTGEPTVAKISSINGYSYGLLVNDYAALGYQFSGIGILGNNALDTMKKAVISDFFKQLTIDLGNGQRQLVYIVTGQNEDGAYEIYTDLELYWGDAGMTYRQPKKLSTQNNITFQKGIATNKVITDAGKDKVLVLNSDSVVLVAAQDGIFTYTGVPVNGATLNTKETTSYAISNDFIFVASKSLTHDKIFYNILTGDAIKPDNDRNQNAYTYYMVVGENTNNKYHGNTTASAAFDGATIVYTYANMYNLNTGEYETITVPNGLKGYQSTDIIGYNAAKPLGAIYAERNGSYKLITENLVESSLDTVLGKYKFAADSEALLAQLLYNTAAEPAYAPVYESTGIVGDASKHGYSITIGKNLISENFPMYYDRIAYTWVDGVMTKVLVDNNKSTTTNYKGQTLYYTYDEGESFKGTVVTTSSSISDTLKAAKTAMIAKLVKSENAGVKETEAYNAEVAAINALTTITEVNAFNYKAANERIAAAKKLDDAAADDAAALAAAKKTAIDAIKAVAAQYDASMVVADGKTVANRVADYEAWYNAMTTVAEIEANSAADVAYFAKQCADAKANADATFKGITNVTANGFSAKNIFAKVGDTLDGVRITVKNGANYDEMMTFVFGISETAQYNGKTYTISKTWDGALGANIEIVATDAMGLTYPVFEAGATYGIVVTVNGVNQNYYDIVIG